MKYLDDIGLTGESCHYPAKDLAVPAATSKRISIVLGTAKVLIGSGVGSVDVRPNAGNWQCVTDPMSSWDVSY